MKFRTILEQYLNESMPITDEKEFPIKENTLNEEKTKLTVKQFKQMLNKIDENLPIVLVDNKNKTYKSVIKITNDVVDFDGKENNEMAAAIIQY